MKNIFEIVVGFLVIFVAIIFGYIVYQSSSHKLDKNDQYVINAIFDNVDGVKLGSEGKISGIVIGKFTSVPVQSCQFQLVGDTQLESLRGLHPVLEGQHMLPK